MEIQRQGGNARYSDIVVHNNVAYIVEVPVSGNADAAAQTREILDSFDSLLALAGSDKSRILSATIYLTDMADYDAMNSAWEAWIPQGSAPSRTCVQVAALAHAGWRVEIALTAAV